MNFNPIIAVFTGCLLSSCCQINPLSKECQASVKLPLCPKLASKSYLKTKATSIGKNLNIQTQQRGIKIDQLNDFVAIFSGKNSDIDWLLENYDELLCDINDAHSRREALSYQECVRQSKAWRELINSEEKGSLLTYKRKYYFSCCDPKY